LAHSGYGLMTQARSDNGHHPQISATLIYYQDVMIGLSEASGVTVSFLPA
jgi:hypothetical protein